MAVIIKFAKPDKKYKYDSYDHTNKDAVAKGIRYIHKGLSDLPKDEQLFGFVGIPEGSSPEQAIDWMMKTKRIYGAEDGVQCRHIIISFGKKPLLKKKKFKKLAEQIVGIWKGHFQVCWGYHYENIGTPEENFQLHILVNSIDIKTGKRLDLNYTRWNKFKRNVQKKWDVMTVQKYAAVADR